MWLSPDRRLIHADASPASLALVRIWVFGIWAVLAVLQPANGMSNFPAEIVVPIGITHLVPSDVMLWLLAPSGLAALRMGLILSCGAAALGFLTRPASVVATVLLILWQSLLRGFMGYANHAEIPLLLAAIVLTCAPCDGALTVWPRPRRQPTSAACQLPLVAILCFTCMTYAFIGTFRMTHGGPALFFSRALPEWILSWNLREPDPASTLGVMWISNPVTGFIGKAGFGLLTLLEISAPACLLSWRFRAFFVPAMFLGHLGILLLMRIDFTNQVLCYLLFIDSRHWSPVYAREGAGVVYFDGVCGLCNRFVDFVLGRDRSRRFRFAPLQGTTATARFGPAPEPEPTTILYEENGVVFERSTAALRIVAALGGVWSMAAVLGLVPRSIRDAVYDWVARHRYAWFGKRDSCRLPTPEERTAFLD